MAAETRIEVAGLKEALRELNKVDRSLRLQISKDYAKIMEPVIWDIKRHVPTQPPLKNWKYPYRKGVTQPLWSGKEAANIKPFTSGTKERHWGPFTSNLGVFGVRWKGWGSTIFDQSRKGSTPAGRSMIESLNAKYGDGSRAMYRDHERHMLMVEDSIRILVAKVMERMNRLV